MGKWVCEQCNSVNDDTSIACVACGFAPLTEKQVRERNLTTGDVVVPPEFNAIGDRAFADTSITSITFHSSVTSIGAEAFSGCKQLQKVVCPQMLDSIGDRAFYNCVALPSSASARPKATVVGKDAFKKERTTETPAPASVSEPAPALSPEPDPEPAPASSLEPDTESMSAPASTPVGKKNKPLAIVFRSVLSVLIVMALALIGLIVAFRSDIKYVHMILSCVGFSASLAGLVVGSIKKEVSVIVLSSVSIVAFAVSIVCGTIFGFLYVW